MKFLEVIFSLADRTPMAAHIRAVERLLDGAYISGVDVVGESLHVEIANWDDRRPITLYATNLTVRTRSTPRETRSAAVAFFPTRANFGVELGRGLEKQGWQVDGVRAPPPSSRYSGEDVVYARFMLADASLSEMREMAKEAVRRAQYNASDYTLAFGRLQVPWDRRRKLFTLELAWNE